MNFFDISEQKVKELFPNETWLEIYKNVFVSQNRKPINSEQNKVFQKELNMAKIASDNSHTVYLLPENCFIENQKNPDAIMDGFLTEFKNITGGGNAVSHRFREALHQGVNVYLKIDNGLSVKRIKQILRGVLINKDNEGIIYCYITAKKVMYCWKMSDLK